MKLNEIVDGLSINPRKLTNYALDPDNPRGRDKALMFQQHLGYTTSNYQSLLEEIYAKALDAEAISQFQDQYGTRYQVDLEIQGVEPDQTETVRTGWLVPLNSKQARLVTVYIKQRT
jgi:hypothetical protein